MDQGVSAVLGSFIGASAAIVSGVVAESFKRLRERRAVALAYAAMIRATVELIKLNNEIAEAKSLASEGSFGRAAANPKSSVASFQRSIAEKYADRLGLLGGDLPSRIVKYEVAIRAVAINRERIENSRRWRDAPKVAFYYGRVAMFYERAIELGDPLVTDLERYARGRTITLPNFFKRVRPL